MREDSFQPIVSKYLHQIVGSVQRASSPNRAAPTYAEATHFANLVTLPGPGEKIALALENVHFLTETNTSLENIRYPGSGGWLILVKPLDQAYLEENEFFLQGLLGPDLSAYFFISSAYKAILQRMVDVEGLTNYMKLIFDGGLAHAQFLAALADSPEAKQLNYSFFLAPCTALPLSVTS